MSENSVFDNPPEVPQTFHQLGILVLDGSSSMGEKGRQNLTKAEEVELAMKEMFSRFNASRIKNNFSFSCVKFDTSATTTLAPTAISNLDYYNEDFNPMSGKGGGTAIYKGLEEAEKIADDFLNNASTEGVYHSVIILLMSDGMCSSPESTKTVANKIKNKNNIHIACAYFAGIGGNNADSTGIKNLMQEVASDPVIFYSTIYDGDTLRNFFEQSMSKSSGVKVID